MTLPDAAELHRMARASEVPPDFQSARRLLNEAAAIEEERRTAMHDLIREAHRLGVGPATLARWSGYDPSRIYQILDR
jgi:hypothetical protein